MAEIIELGSDINNDPTLDEFIVAFKENTKRVIFLVEKEDGTVAIGSNITDRKDLLWDVCRLQDVIRMIMNGKSE